MPPTALPVLYSFRRCPYAMRARLALAVSGVNYELREITLRNKPAEMLAVSPKGTVPVLVLPDGAVIDQSLDIMLWALRHNDPHSWLAPERGTLDGMLALIGENDGPFKQHLDRYKYPNRYAQESGGELQAFAATHRAACSAWLSTLEGLLAEGWLWGGRASLADMALLPFVRQFAHTDVEWFGEQDWPKVVAWLGAFEASELYLGVMGKHAAWVAMSA